VFLLGGLQSGKQTRVEVMNVGSGARVGATTGPSGPATPQQRAAIEKMVPNVNIEFGGHRNAAATAWLQGRIRHALQSPEELRLILESWSERFAFLMLPLATAFLTLLFVFQRRFYVFDHAIFSLHSLSAMGLLFVAAMLLGQVTGGAADLLVLAAPVHLFVHMRGVYRTSIMGTLIRMFLLFVVSLAAFALLMVGLIWVGLALLGPPA
jgi:hypothetical protein